MSDGPDGTLAICLVNVMVKQTQYRLEDKSANDDNADNRVTVTRLELQVFEVLVEPLQPDVSQMKITYLRIGIDCDVDAKAKPCQCQYICKDLCRSMHPYEATKGKYA